MHLSAINSLLTAKQSQAQAQVVRRVMTAAFGHRSAQARLTDPTAAADTLVCARREVAPPA
jgi:hypothetical protein